MDEQPSVSDQRGLLIDNLRNAFGRIVYSHKTHEKAREIASSRVISSKWANIVLISATSGTLLSTVITSQRALLYVSAAFSAATLAFGIFQLSFDPDASAASHGQAAKELWYLRERYLNLLTDAGIGMTNPDIVARRDELTNGSRDVYSHAPGTSSRAYRKAQRALKISEEMYFSDDELDALLPSKLRLKRS